PGIRRAPPACARIVRTLIERGAITASGARDRSRISSDRGARARFVRRTSQRARRRAIVFVRNSDIKSTLPDNHIGTPRATE
ncbi:MAG: hypothetical protein ABIY55_11195, partial [Kofleriaceae bacterium]